VPPSPCVALNAKPARRPRLNLLEKGRCLGTSAAKLMTDESKQDGDNKEARLEKARKELLKTLESLRGGTLTPKEADSVEAAIEDELIALRVSPFPNGE